MKLAALLGLLAVGDVAEVSSPWVAAIVRYGALAVLAWVVVNQRNELARLRTEHSAVIDKLCKRWDDWEKIRHTDAEKLDDTLRMMTRNCAENQIRRELQ